MYFIDIIIDPKSNFKIFICHVVWVRIDLYLYNHIDCVAADLCMCYTHVESNIIILQNFLQLNIKKN